MRLKFCAALIFLLSMILTGCGDDARTDEVKVGMIKYLNASEENMNELIKKIEQKNGEKLSNYFTIYYDSLSSMQMGLSAGNINELSTYRCVSNYTTGQNSALIQVPISFKLSDSFCCAFRQEDSALNKEFDKALEGMIADGTLINLTNKYITNLPVGEEPQSIELPHIDGAPTIKVAVTGDLPPLDLIKADGTPAGFNTAVLAELALTSQVVDVLFWARKPDDNSDLPIDIDRPDGIIFSTPYFSDRIVHLKLSQ